MRCVGGIVVVHAGISADGLQDICYFIFFFKRKRANRVPLGPGGSGIGIRDRV